MVDYGAMKDAKEIRKMSMMGTLEEVYRDMEEGVNDRTEDGKCSNCGACCSALLPLSRKEIKRIKEYVWKHQIKPHRHGSVFADPADLDMCCPFLDERKEHKCDIYEARPDICRHFICNVPPSKVEIDKLKFWATREPCNMWDFVKGE